MASPKLKNEDRARLLQMLAERESYAQIRNAFGITDQTIAYYHDKYKAQIDQARAQYDSQVIDRGLRTRENRIARLERLADRIEKSIEEKTEGGIGKGLWVDDIKVSSGMKFEVVTFAAGAVKEFRGLLDDIAKEVGHRKQEVLIDDVTGLDNAARARRVNSLLDAARDRRTGQASSDDE